MSHAGGCPLPRKAPGVRHPCGGPGQAAIRNAVAKNIGPRPKRSRCPSARDTNSPPSSEKYRQARLHVNPYIRRIGPPHKKDEMLDSKIGQATGRERASQNV